MQPDSDPTFDPNELTELTELSDSPPATVAFGEPPALHLRSFTWAAAMREIESILSWVITNDGVYVIFVVQSRANRYVQARGNDEHGLFIESTGDVFTEDESYDVADLIHLLRLGWRPELLSDETPNWWRESDPRWFYAQPMMAELLVRTIVEIHGATGPADVNVIHGKF